MKVLPHTSIIDYLDGLNLTGREQVNIYLLAQLQGQLDCPQPGYIYDFSLPVEVDDRPVSPQGFPLAQVYSPRETREYGTRPWRVQDLKAILKAEEKRWYPQERLLEPFLYQHIPWKLERGMSSDSTLYVFSGLVDFAQELVTIFTSADQGGRVTLVGRELEEEFLSRLRSRTEGIFQGYRIRTQEDKDLLTTTVRWQLGS
ncbi:MAG: hypothetical protein AABX13_04140 [Nanoarchaeota archaeon]